MQIPEAIMLSKKPFKVRCPACSLTFNIVSYHDGSGQDKVNKMVADYEAHFKNTHAKEDASQAAARTVRETTKD